MAIEASRLMQEKYHELRGMGEPNAGQAVGGLPRLPTVPFSERFASLLIAGSAGLANRRLGKSHAHNGSNDWPWLTWFRCDAYHGRGV
jgi:hypothetical protein